MFFFTFIFLLANSIDFCSDFHCFGQRRMFFSLKVSFQNGIRLELWSFQTTLMVDIFGLLQLRLNLSFTVTHLASLPVHATNPFWMFIFFHFVLELSTPFSLTDSFLLFFVVVCLPDFGHRCTEFDSLNLKIVHFGLSQFFLFLFVVAFQRVKIKKLARCLS